MLSASNELERRLLDVKNTVERARGQQSLLADQIARAKQAAETAKTAQTQYQEAMTLLSKTAGVQRDRVKLVVEPLLTTALRLLLGEQAQFQIVYREQEQSGAIKADLVVTDADGIEGRGTEVHGGGVLDVCSMLLRTIYVLCLGLPKVLVLDEPTRNIHGAKALSVVAEFLQRLAQDAGLQIILITGDEDHMIASADNFLTVQKVNGVSTVGRQLA